MSKILINSKERLKHILTETEYLKTVTTRINTVEDLKNNEDLRRSTERSIRIIGEAIKKLPKLVKKQNPSTEWQEVDRMIGTITNEYFPTNTDVVWEVLTNYIPSLNNEVKKIIGKLNGDEYKEYR